MNIEIPIPNSALAEKLSISVQAIAKWKVVPAERVLGVAEAAEWRVTPHQLRPDLYPHPDDGLPAHLRQTAGVERRSSTDRRSGGDRRKSDRRAEAA